MRASQLLTVLLLLGGAAWLLLGGGEGPPPEGAPFDRPPPVVSSPTPERVEPPAVAPPAPAPAAVADATPPPPPTPERGELPVVDLDRPVSYRDGDRELRAWVNPRGLLEFRPPLDAPRPTLPPVAGARLVSEGRGALLWLLPDDAPPSPDLAERLVREGQGAFSPLLHAEATSGSGALGLPGGVTVVFDPGWDEERVRDFARRHDLGEPTPLTVGPNWYAVKAPPGLASVLKAEEILATGEVQTAMPNFWRPSVQR